MLPRGADAAAGHLNCPYLQCLLINPDVYLSPEAAFRATMLARVPLTVALGHDTSAVYQKVQWPRWIPVWNDNRQRLLSPTQSAEVRHGPIRPDQFQQASTNPVVCFKGKLNSTLIVRRA